MIATRMPALPDLYETDVTAWLEAMAEIAGQRRLAELDCEHLAEFLTDMATRDRRELASSLAAPISPIAWLAVSARITVAQLDGDHRNTAPRMAATDGAPRSSQSRRSGLGGGVRRRFEAGCRANGLAATRVPAAVPEAVTGQRRRHPGRRKLPSCPQSLRYNAVQWRGGGLRDRRASHR